LLGDDNPPPLPLPPCRTWTGKWICTASLTWGLFLFALLVDYVHQLMQLDKDEIDAAHWVQAYKLWHEIRNESARLIQIEWRRYKFETKYEYADDDDPEYEQGIAYLEKLEDRQIRLLRELKRQRARIRLVDTDLIATTTAANNPPVITTVRGMRRSPSNTNLHMFAPSASVTNFPAAGSGGDPLASSPASHPHPAGSANPSMDDIRRLIGDSVAMAMEAEAQRTAGRKYTESEVREIVQEAVFLAQHQCLENLSVLLDRHTERLTEAIDDTHARPQGPATIPSQQSLTTPPRGSFSAVPRHIV
jgi:hypothetical protein